MKIANILFYEAESAKFKEKKKIIAKKSFMFLSNFGKMTICELKTFLKTLN
jgi:hypothetical protein